MCADRLREIVMFDSPNILLSLLELEYRSRISTLAERVSLRRGDVLAEVGKAIEHVYFLESGMSSEIAFDRDGRTIEVGCIGREGYVGIPVVLGVSTSAHRSTMETEGSALRIRSVDFGHLNSETPFLVSLMLKFAHVFTVQVAATAIAGGRYHVERRAARWMLMYHDRTDGNDLPLTHDFLSDMLGVRRSSVTSAVHFIEGEHAIWAARGMITVRDRGKLEELAGGGYGAPEEEYARVIGRPMTRFHRRAQTLSIRSN
jgi:CRP-like cAMP-binding protein